MEMEAWKDRTEQRALKLPFTFKTFLVSICFQVILTSAHTLGKNTSPSDTSLSFWKINLMRQRLKYEYRPSKETRFCY